MICSDCPCDYHPDRRKERLVCCGARWRDEVMTRQQRRAHQREQEKQR